MNMESDLSAELNAGGDSEEELITPEMRACFLKESEEILDQAEQAFLHLSESPDDRDAIALVFRNIHSFKGNCGFFGYAPMERAAHRLENLLETVRGSIRPISLDLVNMALASLDVFRKTLPQGPKAELQDPDGVMARMEAMELGAAVADAVFVENLSETTSTEGDLSKVTEAMATPLAASSNRTTTAMGARRDLRVDLAKLDHLMDLVGELVISTGMIFNYPTLRSDNDPHLEKISHQLRGVVTELQAVALGVRMIPVEGLFRKMSRLVHDLSAKVGKQVKLELRGAETEVDKTLVDFVSDPVVHMIRNALDHGLEAPPERLSAGKPEIGTVELAASQEGGEILITVSDDGRGLSREKILKKAVERGMIDGDPSALSDEEVFQFILRPGFSTAESVTATSGRGVGMDVVKSNIDKLGGRIQIRSHSGRGSQITLRIPLTLSIMEGMLVTAGPSHFILPLISVCESLSPSRDQIVSLIDGSEMLMLRGKALPIVRLTRLLGLPGDCEDLTKGLLIHVAARDQRYCLAVDNLLGQKQTVVKALPNCFGKVHGVSSCSILDDGTIALILDVAGLSELAGRSRRSPPGENIPSGRRAI